MVKRFEVYLVNLDAEVTKNARNTRPCVVLSPDEMNRHSSHVIIAPISSGAAHPTRVPVQLLKTDRVAVLDQLRTVDTSRLVKKIEDLGKPAQKTILDRLQEMFAE